MLVHWNHPDPESACAICRPFVGGTFHLAGILPPPLHDHCRCSLANLPDAMDGDLTTPVDWDAVPEETRAAWLAYARWMIRRHIPFPALLLPLIALLRADSEQNDDPPDPLPVGQPRQRPIRQAPARMVSSFQLALLDTPERSIMPGDPHDPTQHVLTCLPPQTPNSFGGDPAPVSNPTATRIRLTGSILPAGPTTSGANAPIPVRILRAGRTRPIRGFPSGVLITADSLRRAVAEGLFHGVPVFFSHVLGDGRDVRDMAGVLAEAAFDEEEEAVAAALHPYTNGAGAELAALVADFRRHTAAGIPAPDVGVSVDAYFSFDRQADPPAAQRLADLLSVDIVFRPAADGRILAAEHLEGESPMPDPIPVESETPVAEPDDRPLAARSAAALPVAAAQAHAQPAALPDPAAPWLTRLRSAAVTAALAASGLPGPVQSRLAAAAYDSPEQLDSAIQAARDELAQLAAENVIHIGDAPPRGRVSAMRTGLEQIEQAVDWNFGVRSAPVPEPALRSLRTLYHALTGDYDFYGRFEPDRVHLEGATTTTLANLAANALNKVIVQQFSALTFWRWYEQIAYPTPNDGSVQDMQWTVIGGIGDLPQVLEKASYEELDVADVAETDSFVKHGGYVPITLELIRNSDIQRIQAIPRALALAAVRTRSASVAAIFTANGGTGPVLSQDDTPLFDLVHSNLATTALGTTADAWRAARAECFKQPELNSGKQLGLFPRYWLGPADLYDQALALFGYGDGVPTTYAPEAQDRGVHDPRPVPLAVPDFADPADWAYIVDPQVFPVIHISYAQAPGGGVHPAPELFTVASPTAGLMFTNDVLPIKVRDWFAVGVNGYRGIGKRNVAG